jgi:hypothetical protein
MIRIIKIGDIVYEGIEPFYLDENGNRIWNIPQDIEQLKQVLIDTVKWQAYRELSKTDWVVVKCMELGLNLASEYPHIIARREKIRNWVNQKGKEIEEAQTVEQLLELDVYLKEE